MELRGENRFFGSAARALLILVSKCSWAIVMLLWLLALFTFEFVPTPLAPYLLIALALAGAILLGVKMAFSQINFFLKRAEHLLNPKNASRGVFTEEPQSCGISELDSFLKLHRNYVRYLLETISALGEESEKLVERYELLTGNLAAAVVIRDQENKVKYCSPFTEVLTGYPLNTIYESKDDFFLSITHPDDQAVCKRAQAMAAIGEPFQHRYRLFHKSGMEIWVETRTVPLLNSSGEVTSSLSITLDVTGAVRYQKQVEEKNKDLQDFTYMVSHDLKAPIATVKGMVNLLNQDFSKNLEPELRDVITHIGTAADRLHNLVGSILEYSRIASQTVSNSQVNLESAFSDVLTDYSQQIEQTRTAVKIEGELPKVIGGTTQIYQILSNLVGNAIKYRSPARPLILTVKSKAQPFAKKAVLEFIDNGRGIPADKVDTIFRPFARAHGKEIEGSGIGLACVKKLAEKLGGSINVKTAENEGSTFTLELPLAPK